MTEPSAWHAEANADIAALVAWIEKNPYQTARWDRGNWRSRTGVLGTQRHHDHEGGTRTAVQVRDSKRKRNQYTTVFDLDRLEIKVGTRFRPAREVIA